MPISTRQLAKHMGISQSRAVQLKQQGCPMNSLRAATLWRKARIQKRAPTNGKISSPNLDSKRGRPRNPVKPSDSGDGLLDALNDSKAVRRMAFEKYQDAVTANNSDISARLSEHSKATEAYIKAEKSYREEQERRGILVPQQEVIEKCRHAMDQVLRGLKKLPNESGPQCNPTNPLLAKNVLDRAVNQIIATVFNASKGLQ